MHLGILSGALKTRTAAVRATFFSFCFALLVLASCPCMGQSQPIVLGGTLVTPETVMRKGWILIEEKKIRSISEERPEVSSAHIIDTDLLIFPGFVDLHNHPMYAVFPRWRPPQKLKNRYEWRDLDEYKRLIGTPGGNLQKSDKDYCDLDEFAEVKALIGGTTSVTGISSRRPPAAPALDCLTGLVRNLDWSSEFYGPTIGHEHIQHALGVAPRDLTTEAAAGLAQKLKSAELDLLLVHVAEGLNSDLESTMEFPLLQSEGLLASRTGIIHGIALGKPEFRAMHATGAALIWSPRSNMELYGSTTDVATAYREGVSIALAPDWSPTGSSNMLEELRYAYQLNRDHLQTLFSDRQLFEMATSIPARIARIDDKVGSLQAGLYADLFLIGGDPSAPYASLFRSKAEDVQLVMIGGVPMYGSQELLARFNVKPERISVCHSVMQLNSEALPDGPFADVEARLRSSLAQFCLTLAPLLECTPGH